MTRSGIALALLVAGLDAGAATFVVGAGADAGDAVPGDGSCASLAGPCTLRAAVQETNAWPGADVIQLPAGTFTLAIAGAGEDFAATGDLDLREDVTIAGASAAATAIDAAGLDRVLHVVQRPGALAVTIRDVTIRGGAVADVAGAGILHGDEGALVVEDAVLSQNQSSGTTSDSIGGAVASNGVGLLVLRRVLLSENAARRGGAIFYNGTLGVWDSTFAENSAYAGSAINAYGDGTAERCAFVGNQDTGNATILASTASFVLQNATLSANQGSSSTINATGTQLVLESVTSFGNTAPNAGVSAGAGTVSIVNSVLWGNGPGQECQAGGGAIVSLGHNLVADGTCGAGPGELPALDPQLAPLADNGGPTPTHLPAPGSPLANAGLDSACLLEDQRGVLRSLGPGNACDVGAVEFAVPEAGPALAGATALVTLALLRARARRPRRQRTRAGAARTALAVLALALCPSAETARAFGVTGFASASHGAFVDEVPLASVPDQHVGPVQNLNEPAPPPSPGTVTAQASEIVTAVTQGILAVAIGTDSECLGYGPIVVGAATGRAEYDEYVTVSSESVANGTPVTVRLRYRIAFGAAVLHSLLPEEQGETQQYARVDLGLDVQLGTSTTMHRLFQAADGTAIVDGLFVDPAQAAEATATVAVGQTVRVRLRWNHYASSDVRGVDGVFPSAETGATTVLVFGVASDTPGVAITSTVFGAPFPLPGLENVTGANALAAALPITVGTPIDLPEPGAEAGGFAALALVGLRARRRTRRDRGGDAGRQDRNGPARRARPHAGGVAARG